MRKKINRGLVRKDTAKGVLIYFPKEMMPLIDEAVRQHDLDRSKFIRTAVREKLAKGVAI
jgi:metal-responsive CopG/Arc/MetJ family transcriptional regulator